MVEATLVRKPTVGGKLWRAARHLLTAVFSGVCARNKLNNPQQGEAQKTIEGKFSRPLALHAEGAGFVDAVRSIAPRLKRLLLNESE